jgi:hypothetical protein
MMSAQRNMKDARDRAESAVQRNLLIYSLVQLRLVGILILLFVAIKLILHIFLTTDGSPLSRFEAISDLAIWLLFLPLGVGLFLLGGGIERRPNETHFTVAVHHCLLPISIFIFIAMPLITLHDTFSLKQQYQHTMEEFMELSQQQNEWLKEASGSPTAGEVARLARSHQINLAPENEKGGSNEALWQYWLMLENNKQKYVESRPLLQEKWRHGKDGPFFDPHTTITTLLLEITGGLGLFLLYIQGRREISRHGLTPRSFFGASPGGKRTQQQSSRNSRGRAERLPAKRQ